MKFHAIIRLQIWMTQTPKIITTAAKYQEKEEAKMTIGEETLIVNTVTNSIYHIPHYILILNRSIVRVQTDKLYPCQLVAVEEVDQRKQVWEIR